MIGKSRIVKVTYIKSCVHAARSLHSLATHSSSPSCYLTLLEWSLVAAFWNLNF